jgi:carboxymethylenebutenolidase
VSVNTKDVVCESGMPAFVATPRGGGKAPLVVLMHERYGLVQHARDLAERCARDGFACIAPDFFFKHPDQEALHRGDAGYVMSDSEAVESIDAAVAYMREEEAADAERKAIVGMCQTGRYPLVYGAYRPISAAVAWYGAASKREWAVSEATPIGLDALIGLLQCPTLGLFGEGDHIISLEDIANLRASLERGKKSYTIEVFAGAPHGWLNSTMPGRYRREQAEAAWLMQVKFLREVFSGSYGESLITQRYVASVSHAYDFSKNVRYE